MTLKLYAIMVGGSHPSANIELHDIRFCVGETVEDTYRQLRADWWGTPDSLHIDAFAELDIVDGHRVRITDGTKQSRSAERLWFINCGYYENGVFGEGHAYRFMVGSAKSTVWKRVLNDVSTDLMSRHKDNFLDIDDVIDVSASLFHQGISIELLADPMLDGRSPRMVSRYIPMN